jgi:Kef-type K+ transport system membrane component KefB
MPATAVIFIEIGVILLVGRLLGRLLQPIRQPRVIAEILAGLVLGPSLLGRVWPAGAALLFPASSMPVLQLVAQFGLVFFMFLVGLEFDWNFLAGRRHTVLVVAGFGIGLPFALGIGLARWLQGVEALPGIPFWTSALFLGAAMSITAFPVLAAILDEQRLTRSPVGTTALACAAANDLAAWCILAFVVAMVRAQGFSTAVRTTLLALAFVATMLVGLRPLFLLLFREGRDLTRNGLALVLILLLAFSSFTEWIGVHAMLGAFMLGVVLPRTEGFSHGLSHKFEDFTRVFLLPVFLAYSGLRTEIGLIGDARGWLVCGVIIATACLGKFVGVTLSGRWTGMGWREASAVGVLMNTRGLVELVVLNVGLDLGVVSPRLFAMLVVMALVTTFLTTPILVRLRLGTLYRPGGSSR